MDRMIILQYCTQSESNNDYVNDYCNDGYDDTSITLRSGYHDICSLRHYHNLRGKSALEQISRMLLCNEIEKEFTAWKNEIIDKS